MSQLSQDLGCSQPRCTDSYNLLLKVIIAVTLSDSSLTAHLSLSLPIDDLVMTSTCIGYHGHIATVHHKCIVVLDWLDV